MPRLYLDTSALGRVLLAEPDARLIRDTLARYDAWWSSALLLVELRRLARREGIEPTAEKLLSTIPTRRIDLSSVKRAARLDPIEVRTPDAIHLDAAIQLKSRGTTEAVLTYDQQLQSGCAPPQAAGRSPGTAVSPSPTPTPS